jgi:hypothetical protein
LLIEALKPLRVKLPTGPVELRGGQAFEFGEEHALRLLAKVPETVRVVQPDQFTAVDETPFCIDPCPGRPCYWEGSDGIIQRGSGVLLGMMSTGSATRFWVGTDAEDGVFRWVREDRLRTTRQYESQATEHPTAICMQCGTGGPFRWVSGALLCMTCRAGEVHG